MQYQQYAITNYSSKQKFFYYITYLIQNNLKPARPPCIQYDTQNDGALRSVPHHSDGDLQPFGRFLIQPSDFQQEKVSIGRWLQQIRQCWPHVNHKTQTETCVNFRFPTISINLPKYV
jgi:hypothetical protein